MTTAQTKAHYFNDIINGDCLKVLPKLTEGSVDFILTDPPYLVVTKTVQDAASGTMTMPPG